MNKKEVSGPDDIPDTSIPWKERLELHVHLGKNFGMMKISFQQRKSFVV